METFFNHPTALNVKEAIPFGEAMVSGSITFVVNVVINVVAAAIGYGIAKVGPSAR